MSVAILITHMRAGGPTSVVRELLCGLQERGVRAWLVTLQCDSEDEDPGPNIRCLHMSSKLGGLPNAVSRLRSIADELELSVVHSHGVLPDLVSWLALGSSLPRVATVHNVQQEDYPNTYGHVAGSILTMLHRLILGRGFLIVACSDSVRAALPVALRTKARVIRNGVRGAVRPASERMRARPRDGARALTLISIGGLTRAKGVAELVSGFGEHRLAGERLLLLGDGPLRGVIEEGGFPGVSILGHRNDIYAVLSEADLYVSNSHSEGFPMAALEAVSAGVAPVLSDIPAHRELLASLPVGGMFPRDDIDAMLRVARQLDRSGGGGALIAHHKTTLDASFMVSSYLSLYGSVEAV